MGNKIYCNFSISEKGVLASLTSDKLGILRNSCLPTPGLPVATRGTWTGLPRGR